MTTYIQQLASELLRRFGTDMSRVAVVFPNKRASLFLNMELARQAAKTNGEGGNTTFWSPSYITISQLFRNHSSLKVADQILLVCRLYDVFMRCTGFQTETQDHFFNWGLLLLSDFDDLDKNMADAKKVFSLVKDLHELDNDDYLSDHQQKILKEFFRTFNDGHSTMLREKFLRLWSHLYDIYSTFRNELRADGLAYEGMLYRDVCEQKELCFEYEYYCFAGFNMLQQVEQQLFMKLKTEGKALFYWDYDPYYLKDNHEAGHFISNYLKLFPEPADSLIHKNQYGLFSTTKPSSLTYISAPTEHLQARYIHDWLLQNDRWKDGAKTAIVMCDENLLQTVIRSLPEEVKNVNITTGYPLAQSPITSLLQMLIEMQTDGHFPGTDKYRLKYVNNVLQHPFSTYISKDTKTLYKYLNKYQVYFPSRKDLIHKIVPSGSPEAEGSLPISPSYKEGKIGGRSSCEGRSLLFADLDTYGQGISAIGQWLMQIVTLIAINMKKVPSGSPEDSIAISPSYKEGAGGRSGEGGWRGQDVLHSEATFRTYQLLTRLHTLTSDGTLNIDIPTYKRLLMQIIRATNVPYHGEPIAGIQIMGVLETRCLDFKHLLILSCNEGNMPKGVNDSSFIPHTVRQAYHMTTVEHKVGIYSYYFHRLLQRTSDATLTYNSSTDGINTGEMSRFMLQLLLESQITIKQQNLVTGQDNTLQHPKPVVKDQTVMRRLRNLYFGPQAKPLSPSSLAIYLRCQLRYYYQYVIGIKEDTSDIDEMDNRTFGNIFHKAAELIYEHMKDKNGYIHPTDLKNMLANKKLLKEYVNKAFATELFHTTVPSGSPEGYTGLHLINHNVITRLLTDLLRYDIHHAPLKIIGNELKAYLPLQLKQGQVTIGGTIDRLDIPHATVPSASPEGSIPMGEGAVRDRIRVIDYKTGFNEPIEPKTIADIFNQNNISKHTDYYLQAMLYAYIIRHHTQHNPYNHAVTPALLYVQKVKKENYTPTLKINGTPITDIADVEQEYIAALKNIIEQILNPDLNFHPTTTTKICEQCPFAQMCNI